MRVGMREFQEALKAENANADLSKLALSIFGQESGFGSNAVKSINGAMGAMQVMPATFRQYADKGMDIENPLDNLRVGIRYANAMLKLADGDPRLAAVGYYGGPGGIAKAKKGIAVSNPLRSTDPTTFEYADQVVARMNGQPIPKLVRDKQLPVQPAPVQEQVANVSVPVPAPVTTPTPLVSGTDTNTQKAQAVPTYMTEDQLFQKYLASMQAGQEVPSQSEAAVGELASSPRNAYADNPMAAFRAPDFSSIINSLSSLNSMGSFGMKPSKGGLGNSGSMINKWRV